MKLALIRRQFSATGGAELYLQRLLAALAGRGHELHLFAEWWNGAPAGVMLHPVNVSASRATRGRRFADAVQSELAREKFDCVFSLERTLKQDVYRAGDGVHRVWLERRRQFAPWWKKPFAGLGAFHKNMIALEARTFDPQNTRHVIVNSEMVKREILEKFQFPAERIHLVRNGVDAVRFQNGKRAETRARFGVKDGEFLLLFAGSGWERKGLKFLQRLMNDLRQAQSVLRRKAPEQSRAAGILPKPIKLLVAGKGRQPVLSRPDIIFAGPIKDIENIYAAADLFVFLPVYEPSSNVVYESLAAGLPVVSTAQDGSSELIREGVNGSVVQNPADRAAVFAAVGFWMQNPAPHPVKIALDISINKNVSETLSILELAAKEKAG